MTDNTSEIAELVIFHFEEDRKAPHVAVRATGRNISDEDISVIARNITAKTGISISGRFVPESEHGLAGETIIEFTNKQEVSK